MFMKHYTTLADAVWDAERHAYRTGERYAVLILATGFTVTTARCLACGLPIAYVTL